MGKARELLAELKYLGVPEQELLTLVREEPAEPVRRIPGGPQAGTEVLGGPQAETGKEEPVKLDEIGKCMHQAFQGKHILDSK